MYFIQTVLSERRRCPAGEGVPRQLAYVVMSLCCSWWYFTPPPPPQLAIGHHSGTDNAPPSPRGVDYDLTTTAFKNEYTLAPPTQSRTVVARHLVGLSSGTENAEDGHRSNIEISNEGLISQSTVGFPGMEATEGRIITVGPPGPVRTGGLFPWRRVAHVFGKM